MDRSTLSNSPLALEMILVICKSHIMTMHPTLPGVRVERDTERILADPLVVGMSLRHR
jgi:hypothetical protein